MTPKEVLFALVPKKLASLEIMVASAKDDIPDDLMHAAEIEIVEDEEGGKRLRVWYDEDAKRVSMAKIAPALTKTVPAKRRWWQWRRAA